MIFSSSIVLPSSPHSFNGGKARLAVDAVSPPNFFIPEI
jgi:hypothetical protein